MSLHDIVKSYKPIKYLNLYKLKVNLKIYDKFNERE